MYDGERQWEIYEVKANLFSVDILPAESKLINKAKPELPLAVKQQLQTHVSVSLTIFASKPSKRVPTSK